MDTVEFRSLHVNQSGFSPVFDLSLTIGQGECVALFGEKEADTVLALLSGFCEPDAGEGSVMGYDLGKQTEKIRHLTSFLPDADGASPRLSVSENIELFLRLCGKKKKEAAERAMRLMASFDLLEKATVPAASLSQGYRKRLSLALAQASDPALLLLKTPLKDLSTHQKREVLDLLAKRKGKCTTVFSTQDPFVAAALGDRIAIFKDGALVAFDRTQALLTKTATNRLSDAIAVLLKEEEGAK
ncbi:MAG: ABC transporter ATP-binding protein [Clostridia bacterium]|nr:ABC transporter ATP-binding protein [Clostridia bacterium]